MVEGGRDQRPILRGWERCAVGNLSEAPAARTTSLPGWPPGLGLADAAGPRVQTRLPGSESPQC